MQQNCGLSSCISPYCGVPLQGVKVKLSLSAQDLPCMPTIIVHRHVLPAANHTVREVCDKLEKHATHSLLGGGV